MARVALKAVLFDLDGTLLDSIPLIRQTFLRTFAELGLTWGEGEVMRTVGLPLRQVAERYAPGREVEFLRLYSEHNQEKRTETLKLFPGALETVEFLWRSGYRQALVTSKRRVSALAGTTLTGLDRYLETVVTCDDVVRSKPHPDCLFKALEMMAIGQEEAVYVGDSWHDIQTGKNAGVATAGVSWGMASHQELTDCNPDFIAADWAELIAFLSGRGADGVGRGR